MNRNSYLLVSFVSVLLATVFLKGPLESLVGIFATYTVVSVWFVLGIAFGMWFLHSRTIGGKPICLDELPDGVYRLKGAVNLGGGSLIVTLKDELVLSKDLYFNVFFYSDNRGKNDFRWMLDPKKINSVIRSTDCQLSIVEPD